MRARADNGQTGGGNRTDLDRATACYLAAVGILSAAESAPDTHIPAKKNGFRRRINNTQHGSAIAYERDVDREITALLNEFLGAIERIDEKEFSSRGRYPTRSDFFLGNGRNLRCG